MSEEEKPQVETLVQFFGLDKPFKADEGRRRNSIEELANSAAGAALGKSLGLIPLPLQKLAGDSLDDALKLVLKTPLKEIMAKAWNQRRDLLRYCDRTKYPREETFRYALDENAISYAYQPSIQLMLNEKSVGPPIRFEVNIALVCNPVLKIQDAHVLGASVGAVQGKGRVSCEGAILIERKSEKFTLPGELSFGRGFAIGQPLGKDVAGAGAPNWWSRAVQQAQSLARRLRNPPDVEASSG